MLRPASVPGGIWISGGARLVGSTPVQPCQSSARHLYATAILADESVVLTGVPESLATDECTHLLRRIGARVSISGGCLVTEPPLYTHSIVPDELARDTRTTAVIASALLARTGEVQFRIPGGSVGARNIQPYLRAMLAVGAKMDVTGDRVCAQLPFRRLPFVMGSDKATSRSAFGATVVGLLLAARTPGTSTILRPSTEPEILAMTRMLADLGVGITWRGLSALEVTGSEYLIGGVIALPPDELEAIALAFAVAVTHGTVHLVNFDPDGFTDGVLTLFSAAGIDVSRHNGGTVVECSRQPRAVHTVAGPYPAFPGRARGALTALLAVADGISQIQGEALASPRFAAHIEPLRALGADIVVNGTKITVRGRPALVGNAVHGESACSVAALVIAALAAEGMTTVHGGHLLRGYFPHLVPKLAALGAVVVHRR
ncbi:hypothetical protein OHV05_36445 (plasmid) [Kitasatospora sp. NBC_00070]|uniref:hypothetical protein n=1 Tax=Kitasatospora sp. NBC_00070 TaxID=2975962 RepID=UPI002F914135